MLAAVAVLVAVGGFVVWNALRPPKPVSVSQVVDKFRHRPQPTATTAHHTAGPDIGVYVYATKGTERISVGDIVHTYPARTTLTVTDEGCGIRLRWDALSGRWSQWQVCSTPLGWRLDHYTDVHKFLYMSDVHDYTCTSVIPVSTGADWTVVCRYGSGQLTSTVHTVGVEQRQLDGTTVRTTHLRITQHGTGSSLSDGVIDAWVLGSGLPVRVATNNHGSQVVLGQHVTYRESATFDLTSATPRR